MKCSTTFQLGMKLKFSISFHLVSQTVIVFSFISGPGYCTHTCTDVRLRLYKVTLNFVLKSRFILAYNCHIIY